MRKNISVYSMVHCKLQRGSAASVMVRSLAGLARRVHHHHLHDITATSPMLHPPRNHRLVQDLSSSVEALKRPSVDFLRLQSHEPHHTRIPHETTTKSSLEFTYHLFPQHQNKQLWIADTWAAATASSTTLLTTSRRTAEREAPERFHMRLDRSIHTMLPIQVRYFLNFSQLASRLYLQKLT